MHISASVSINDDESGLHQNFEVQLEKLAPEKPHSQYRHNGAEDNVDAHLKRTIMGREVVLAVAQGRLDFGTWEQIFYGEFDGMRRKRVLVKIIGEQSFPMSISRHPKGTHRQEVIRHPYAAEDHRERF